MPLLLRLPGADAAGRRVAALTQAVDLAPTLGRWMMQAGGALLNRQYGIKGGNDTIPGGFSQMNITGYRALRATSSSEAAKP